MGRFGFGIVVLVLAAGAAPAGRAQQPAPAAMDHRGAMAGPAGGGEMMRSMEKMNRDMAGAPMTGDADRDFVAMMMPHHQGAIDMARIYLRDGKDPVIRKMAQAIIADQEREIRAFKAWQGRAPAHRH